MVIMGAGAINHRELCNLACRYFGGLRMELDKEQRRSGRGVYLNKGKFVDSNVR